MALLLLEPSAVVPKSVWCPKDVGIVLTVYGALKMWALF